MQLTPSKKPEWLAEDQDKTAFALVPEVMDELKAFTDNNENFESLKQVLCWLKAQNIIKKQKADGTYKNMQGKTRP
jgi:hypothetical protein